jgi:hypothetical protein
MRTRRSSRPWTFALAVTITACAGNPAPDDTVERPVATDREDAQTLPPAGYGTLRQDDFTIDLQSDDLQIKVTPLNESVIRLAAPDTYQRLHGLATSRDDRVREIAANAGLQEPPKIFLVSFFTRSRQAEYKPTDLQLLSQGILYRPLDIVPITSDWGRELVRQERTQSALYVFDPAVDLDVALQVEYAGQRALDWSSILGVLEAEEGRVRSRARS